MRAQLLHVGNVQSQINVNYNMEKYESQTIKCEMSQDKK